MPALILLMAIVLYALASVVTFLVFALDKRRAKLGLPRTPERTLHTLSLIGGFLGAIAAMVFVRHKNRKVLFVAVTIAIAILHGAVWTLVLALVLRDR